MKSTDPSVTVQVTVTGVIYADGKLDAVNQEGLRRMQQIQDGRAGTARAETEANAIFTKYASEVDTTHRFEEIRQAMLTQINEVPKRSYPESGSSEFQMLLQTLDQLQGSPEAQQLLDWYTAYLATQHRLRTELLPPVKH